MRNIVWFEPKLECVAKVVQFYIHAKHFSFLVENGHLVWFEYTEFHISINPFGIGKCVLGTFLPEASRRHTAMR